MFCMLQGGTKRREAAPVVPNPGEVPAPPPLPTTLVHPLHLSLNVEHIHRFGNKFDS